MKKASLISIAIIFYSILSAQTEHGIWNTVPESVKQLRQHVFAQMKNNEPANKTTVMKQRLIGLAQYLNDGTAYSWQDSSYLTYSGSRGSKIDMNYPLLFPNESYPDNGYALYDTRVYYGASQTQGDDKYVESYNSSDKLLMDLIQHFNGTSFQDSAKFEYAYNSFSKPATINYYYKKPSNQWFNLSRHKLVYDAQGKLIADTMFIDSGLGLEFFRLNTYFYAGTNLVQEIEQVWSGIWDNSYKYTYNYYPSNKIRSCTVQNSVDGFWVDYLKDSLGYNANNILNYEELHQNSGAGWTYYMLETRHVSAASLPDSIFISQGVGSGWFLNETQVIRYNAYNNPDSQIIYNPFSLMPDAKYFFYYELYNVGLENISYKNNIVLFPNPIDDLLHLQIPEDAKAERYIVSIFNSLGQEVSETIFNGKNISIPAAHLKPGFYFLQLSNKEGTEAYQKSFIKN